MDIKIEKAEMDKWHSLGQCIVFLTLSAAESKASAILSKLGAFPVYMYVSSSDITGCSTSVISTRFWEIKTHHITDNMA